MIDFRDEKNFYGLFIYSKILSFRVLNIGVFIVLLGWVCLGDEILF